MISAPEKFHVYMTLTEFGVTYRVGAADTLDAARRLIVKGDHRTFQIFQADKWTEIK